MTLREYESVIVEFEALRSEAARLRRDADALAPRDGASTDDAAAMAAAARRRVLAAAARICEDGARSCCPRCERRRRRSERRGTISPASRAGSRCRDVVELESEGAAAEGERPRSSRRWNAVQTLFIHIRYSYKSGRRDANAKRVVQRARSKGARVVEGWKGSDDPPRRSLETFSRDVLSRRSLETFSRETFSLARSPTSSRLASDVRFVRIEGPRGM